MLDVVLVLQLHAHDADAAAALLAVRGHGQALHVARARDRNDHVLFRDQVLELQVALGRDDLRSAVVPSAVELLDLEQLLANESIDLGLVGENRPQLGDTLLQVRELLLDLLAGKTGEAREAEVENRLRLDLCQLEALLKTGARLVRVGCVPDQRDDLVEVVERREVALRGCARAPPPVGARTSSGE